MPKKRPEKVSTGWERSVRPPFLKWTDRAISNVVYVGLLQVAGMDVEKAKFNEMSPPPSGGVRKGTTAPEGEGLLHNRH